MSQFDPNMQLAIQQSQMNSMVQPGPAYTSAQPKLYQTSNVWPAASTYNPVWQNWQPNSTVTLDYGHSSNQVTNNSTIQQYPGMMNTNGQGWDAGQGYPSLMQTAQMQMPPMTAGMHGSQPPMTDQPAADAMGASHTLMAHPTNATHASNPSEVLANCGRMQRGGGFSHVAAHQTVDSSQLEHDTYQDFHRTEIQPTNDHHSSGPSSSIFEKERSIASVEVSKKQKGKSRVTKQNVPPASSPVSDVSVDTTDSDIKVCYGDRSKRMSRSQSKKQKESKDSSSAAEVHDDDTGGTNVIRHPDRARNLTFTVRDDLSGAQQNRPVPPAMASLGLLHILDPQLIQAQLKLSFVQQSNTVQIATVEMSDLPIQQRLDSLQNQINMLSTARADHMHDSDSPLSTVPSEYATPLGDEQTMMADDAAATIDTGTANEQDEAEAGPSTAQTSHPTTAGSCKAQGKREASKPLEGQRAPRRTRRNALDDLGPILPDTDGTSAYDQQGQAVLRFDAASSGTRRGQKRKVMNQLSWKPLCSASGSQNRPGRKLCGVMEYGN